MQAGYDWIWLDFYYDWPVVKNGIKIGINAIITITGLICIGMRVGGGGAAGGEQEEQEDWSRKDRHICPGGLEATL